MKQILRFMKGQGLGVLLVFLLLIAQAWCDLSLPSYTSDILNVGLQQGGIEDAAMDTVRAAKLEELEIFVSDEELELLESAYLAADEAGIRKLSSDADRKKVSDALMLPESVLYMLETSQEIPVTTNQIKAAMKLGLVSREQMQSGIQEAMASYGTMSDTYLKQLAVRYVSEEYEAQGVDLSAIQSRYLWKVGLKMIIMAFFMSLTAVMTGYLAARISSSVGRQLRERMYDKVMHFTSAEMEHFSTASLITRATNDIQQIQMVIVMLLRMVAYAPILAVFGIVKVVQTKSGMSWIIVVAVIILSALVGILVGIAMPKFKKMQILVDRLNQVSRELLTGIMPIRAFSRERHEEERFARANQELHDTQLFTGRTMSFMMPIMMFVMNGISVLIVWVGARRVDLGAVQVGDLTAFITYSMVIVMGFLMISMISIFLPRASVAAQRIAEVLDEPIQLQDREETKDALLSELPSTLAFHDVTFNYPGASGSALKHIDFIAETGKTTAIIGSTGCGKSTLLNLIPRFFDVTEGSITLGGVDIRDFSQKALRDQIGYAPQKGVLFSGTVESNLKYAGDQVTDNDMIEAARIAQAEDFILEKEMKYQSPIAQEGSNVSGGQRQRLSIARAVAKHPKVYLFDDTFSALDYRTDLALRKALADRTKDATVIIVAQRISTILHADRILCMEHGEIVGQGTHEELMKTCPTYQEIARSQLSDVELGLEGGKTDV